MGPGGAAGGGARPPAGEAAARRAADDYEAVLRSIFAPGDGIDLILLGIGTTATRPRSFPGSAALDEREHWAIAALEDPTTAAAMSGSGERLWRVSSRAPFINRAALVLFVVTGAAKAAVVSGALRGEGDPREWPVLLIRPAPGGSCGCSMMTRPRNSGPLHTRASPVRVRRLASPWSPMKIFLIAKAVPPDEH